MQLFGLNITTEKPEAIKSDNGAVYVASAGTASGGAPVDVEEQFAPVYEDNTAGKAVIEQRYSTARSTTDATVLTGAGYLKSIQVFANNASVTAGTVSVYDGTNSSGTLLGTLYVSTTATTYPPIVFNRQIVVGIFLDFTTLAGVDILTQYRA